MKVLKNLFPEVQSAGHSTGNMRGRKSMVVANLPRHMKTMYWITEFVDQFSIKYRSPVAFKKKFLTSGFTMQSLAPLKFLTSSNSHPSKNEKPLLREIVTQLLNKALLDSFERQDLRNFVNVAVETLLRLLVHFKWQTWDRDPTEIKKNFWTLNQQNCLWITEIREVLEDKVWKSEWHF